MISGIHLATALSVMLHMEQEGNGMDTKEVIYRLRDAAEKDEGPYANAVMRVWGPLPEFQMYRDLSFAADRLSEQQQVIDELVEALSNLETRASSYISAHGQMTEAFKDGMNVHGALSVFVGAEDMYESAIVDARNAVANAKGYTKDAD